MSLTAGERVRFFHEKYGIPPDISIIVPTIDDLASQPPEGYTSVYIESHWYGLRFPQHPFICTLLKRIKQPLGQLNPMSYCVIVACYIMWFRFKCRGMTVGEFYEFVFRDSEL